MRRLVFDQSSQAHPVSESRWGSPERDIHRRSSRTGFLLYNFGYCIWPGSGRNIHIFQKLGRNTIDMARVREKYTDMLRVGEKYYIWPELGEGYDNISPLNRYSILRFP